MHKLLTKGELITYSLKLWVIFQTKYSCRGKVTAQSWRSSYVCKNDLSFEKTISMVKWALLNRSLVKKFSHFPEENKTIEVDKYEWQNIRYKVDALLRK
jgi:hypothetical protein